MGRCAASAPCIRLRSCGRRLRKQSCLPDMRLEGAVVEIARSGQEYSSVDMQLSLGFRRDLDMSAANVAFTLAPGADPVVCLRRLHRCNRRQRSAWQPSGDPDPLRRQRRMVGNASELAPRGAGEHEVAGHKIRVFLARIRCGWTGFGSEVVVVWALHKIDAWLDCYCRYDQGALVVPADAIAVRRVVSVIRRCRASNQQSA